ncbi:MAG: zinc protease [Gammaproteobacteria bacterium]|jgi:zinc protease
MNWNFWIRLLQAAFVACVSTHAQSVEVERWTTSNGMMVFFNQSKALPLVDFQLSFRAGSAYDGELPGLAGLTNALLIDGYKNINAQQVAVNIESLGARIGYGTSRDRAWMSLRSLSYSDHLEPAVKLFANIVSEPAFPEDALERDRKNLLSGLKERLNQPSALADYEFNRALYKGHPYQYGSSGHELSVEKISRNDLLFFHRRLYVSANANLAISGDLSLSEAKIYAELIAKPLNRGERSNPVPPVSPTLAQTDHYSFESKQTHIRIGLPVLRRDNPDYYALKLGNQILGGSAQSWLMQSLREEQGLTYGVYSHFSAYESRGPFQISLQTQNENVDRVLASLKLLMTKFIENGPSEVELEAAKKNLTGSLALSQDSNRKINSQLAFIGFYDLELNYLEVYKNKIRSIDVEEIRSAFRQYLKMDHLLTVTVGSDLE